MAKVKILLAKGESERDAEDLLLKSILHHSTGEVHAESGFQDPAMEDLANKMTNIHARIYQEMLQEIFEVLDAEYKL